MIGLERIRDELARTAQGNRVGCLPTRLLLICIHKLVYVPYHVKLQATRYCGLGTLVYKSQILPTVAGNARPASNFRTNIVEVH